MKMNQEPVISVGIVSDPVIHFQLKGKFWLNNQIIHEGEYKAEAYGNIIHTGFAGHQDIEIWPAEPLSTFTINHVKIGIGFHWEQYESQEFEGGLKLQLENGKISAVNIIALESYLKSVISSEMSAMNDLNLLKAHAIVSRSWLMAQLMRTAGKATAPQTQNVPGEIIKWYDRQDHESFDVCADDHCQRYQGITKLISKNAEEAVTATRGQFLMYHDQICDARFSKCCGGITEAFENVWQPQKIPYLTSIIDTDTNQLKEYFVIGDGYFNTSPHAFCNTSDPEILKQVLIDFDQKTTNFYRWEEVLLQDELQVLLKKKSGIDFGAIIDLIPVERGFSGRIIKLKIIGTKHTVVVGKELEIRKWLSETHLYSSAFMVNKELSPSSDIPVKFKLTGAGWGHGVGMCQIGAAVMSQRGFSVDAILQHYFKGAVVNKLY